MSLSKFPLAATLCLGLSLTAIADADNDGSGAIDQSQPSSIKTGPWADISTYLDQILSSGWVRGYGFAIFDQNHVLFQQAGGVQNLNSVEPLASASKLPAVAAIMTLVDSGRLNLDTPIGAYLYGHINWPFDKANITMRMLLSHTSGFQGDNGGPNTPSCLLNRLTTLDYCAQQIADTPLDNKPGTAFAYTGTNYQLAGYVASVISCKSWADFFDAAIGKPLGWNSFHYTPTTTRNPLIGGGASSNLNEYATFLRMILDDGTVNGKRILSVNAVETMKTNEISGSVQKISYSPLPPLQYPGYSMGLFISDPILYPGSPGPEYSDPGIYGTIPWFDTGLNYGAVLLLVTYTSTGILVWDGLRPLIITEITSGANN